MAANDGEERLLTLFADVHYYFSEPTPRPTAHRFDKGSYLYLYGNRNRDGARLEIANNVGKPEQDAFTGSMDSVDIRQSHKHPTLCTVTVDATGSRNEDDTASVPQPEHHWRLPNTDPRNEGKYLFRLHTLDVYFWKSEDAHAFIAAARSKLHHNQVEVSDVPPIPVAHEQLASPVVQQLENVAVQDPAYRNGQTRNSRTASSGVIGHPKLKEEESPREAQTPAAFQPLAYNPAAPAAPEPIKHREKTPPPLDAEDGTGLAGAAIRDHKQATSPEGSLSRTKYGQEYHGQMSSQPSHPSQTHLPQFASPTPSAGYMQSLPYARGHRTPSIASPPPPPPPQSGQGSVSPYNPASSFAAPPSAQSLISTSSQQESSTFSAPPQDRAPFYRKDTNPPESPATEILGNSYVGGVRQPLQHLQPQYASYTPPSDAQVNTGPVGGYSDYRYDQQQSRHDHHHHNQHPQSSDYDIHSQVYRPTTEEASKRKPPKVSNSAAASPSGRLEQGAGKVDKKVNSFFKKLEKKIG